MIGFNLFGHVKSLRIVSDPPDAGGAAATSSTLLA